MVRVVMNAKKVRSRDDAPKLWDAVHAVTPWHVRPAPRIYVVNESRIDVFTFGLGPPFFTAIVVMGDLVEYLNEKELRAVMAHEIGHIINRDFLVSKLLTIAVMMITLTGLFLFSVEVCTVVSDSKDGNFGMAFPVTVFVGAILYGIGRVSDVPLKMFVFRQREYAADAMSAKIMGSSQPLISALGKVMQSPSINTSTQNAASGFMCTADPDPSDFFATHPSPAKRFVALHDLER